MTDETPQPQDLQEGYNLRSRQVLTSAERFRIWKEQTAATGTPTGSGNVIPMRPLVLQGPSGSRVSETGSHHSSKSQASRIERERLELETQEELEKLQEEEDSIEQTSLQLKKASIQQKKDLLRKKETFLRSLIEDEDDQQLSSDKDPLGNDNRSPEVNDKEIENPLMPEFLRDTAAKAKSNRLVQEEKADQERETAEALKQQKE